MEKRMLGRTGHESTIITFGNGWRRSRDTGRGGQSNQAYLRVWR